MKKRPITTDRGGVKDPLNARNLLFMLKNTKFAGRNYRLKVGVISVEVHLGADGHVRSIPANFRGSDSSAFVAGSISHDHSLLLP